METDATGTGTWEAILLFKPLSPLYNTSLLMMHYVVVGRHCAIFRGFIPNFVDSPDVPIWFLVLIICFLPFLK
jgi:hypothetical protein